MESPPTAVEDTLLEEKLRLFYRKHDPGKVPHVATIIRSPRYKGSRQELLKALAAKYGHTAVAECMGNMSEYEAKRGQRSKELSPMDGHAHLDGVQPTFLENAARQQKPNTNTILQSVLEALYVLKLYNPRRQEVVHGHQAEH